MDWDTGHILDFFQWRNGNTVLQTINVLCGASSSPQAKPKEVTYSQNYYPFPI